MCIRVGLHLQDFALAKFPVSEALEIFLHNTKHINRSLTTLTSVHHSIRRTQVPNEIPGNPLRAEVPRFDISLGLIYDIFAPVVSITVSRPQVKFRTRKNVSRLNKVLTEPRFFPGLTQVAGEVETAIGIGIDIQLIPQLSPAPDRVLATSVAIVFCFSCRFFSLNCEH